MTLSDKLNNCVPIQKWQLLKRPSPSIVHAVEWNPPQKKSKQKTQKEKNQNKKKQTKKQKPKKNQSL